MIDREMKVMIYILFSCLQYNILSPSINERSRDIVKKVEAYQIAKSLELNDSMHFFPC